ncbi:hypothetical protein [Streptomyces sp. NPDC093707]|uniref:hypothetical protein n=1 Tax=Streptomyces sp. NPDC093707 TaxID=3154984 RepID=UPI00344EF1D0
MSTSLARGPQQGATVAGAVQPNVINATGVGVDAAALQCGLQDLTHFRQLGVLGPQSMPLS